MNQPTPTDSPARPERRTLMARVSALAMFSGLGAGYGALGWIAARFLYPARPDARGWMYVAPARRFAAGQSVLYRGPSGESVSITRQGDAGSADDFIALSSTCPHLGCQVHWQSAQGRFFCPCHNGTFDTEGRGTGGPPGDAKQSLPRYPLKIANGLLFIEVPTAALATRGRWLEIEAPAAAGVIAGPGHDPCLAGRADTEERRA